MDKFLEIVNKIWAIGVVRFLVYIALAFLAAGIASWLVKKVLKLIKLDKKLDKWGVDGGVFGTFTKFIGKIVFLVVFLLFLPSALEAIGVTSASGPISGLANTFISYIPNIIAAAVLIYVGVMVAQILGQIVSVLLKKTKVDALVKRKDSETQQKICISDVIVKLLMGVIVLITIVAALGVLNIKAISEPAFGIVSSIFGAIPPIILAVAVVSIGIFVASIACNVLYNLLIATNFDNVVKKILPQIKISATKIVVNIVRTIIILFVAAQGIEALNLSILTMIVTGVVSYIPLVLKASAILLAALIGTNLLEKAILKAKPGAIAVVKIAKVGIFTVAGFMILSQLEIASTIVNVAFIVILSAIAVAFAISFALAFGLGGKDFAKKTLTRVDDKIEDACSKRKARKNAQEAIAAETTEEVVAEEAPAEEAPAEEAPAEEAPAEEAPAEEAPAEEAPAEEAPAEEAKDEN